MGNLTLTQAQGQLNDLAKQWALDKVLDAFDPEGAKQDLLRLVNDMDIHSTGSVTVLYGGSVQGVSTSDIIPALGSVDNQASHMTEAHRAINEANRSASLS
jgi:hypothetical protein